MCSCPGPAKTPACMRSLAPNPTAPASWTCPTATSPTPTCSWPRPCPVPVARPWPSTSPIATTCGGCPRRSCAPSGTGCAASWIRPPGIAAASWPGPPPKASRPRKPWPPTSRRPAGMLRWLRGHHERPVGMPGGLAVATQQANRAHDRERELRQHQQRRDGWLEANAHLGPQYRQVVRTLAWQRRATGLAVEAERPGYVLEALGPVPESTRGRRAWRHAAAEIEQYRHIYQITDRERALGPEPHAPGQRAARQRARTAIERVQAKQRSTDRSRDHQPTSERTSQPQPHEQRGRRGPERAAG